MNRLSKILSSLTLAVVLALPFSGLANAAGFWKVDISTPATQSSRTFNVQYTTLSTESADVIDVDLYQDGAMIDSQTTIPAGDSGAFAVTVPDEGTYEYYIVADNAGETQTTATKTVQVVSPPTVTNTVTVANPNADTTGSTTSSNGNTTTGTNGGQTNGTSDNEGGSDGQVNASGNNSDDNAPKTLGESEAKTDDKKDSKTAWTIIIIAAAAALLYANRGRFMRSKKDN